MENTFIVEIAQADGGVNAVAVSVDHDKYRKQIVAAYYPAVKGQGGQSPQIVVTSGKYFNIEPMPRLNRAVVNRHVVGAKAQIAQRKGQYYDHFVAFLADKGYGEAA